MPRTITHRAPVVISSVGAPATFERLLPVDGEIGSKTAPLRALIGRLGAGLSSVTLYLRLKADPRTIGVQGENHWINTAFDHEDIAAQTRGVISGEPRSIYVSFPSIKAGDSRFHTAEIIAFVGEDAFAAWRDRPKGNRGADYSALKQRIGEGLLRLADRSIPGLASLVEYSELATPLTVEHYTSHPGGRFYGVPATPERYRSDLLWPRTPVGGLYLAGQDAGCLGIVGAMMGGVGAACQVLGARGMPMIRAALKSRSAGTAGEIRLPHTKRRAVLTSRRRLTPTIWGLAFEIDGEPGEVAPGQFARLQVGEGEWRDYSIAGVEGRTVQFLISTRTGGHGSRFVEAASIGARTLIELPLGQYALVPNAHRKVFVATGTGLAPFLPMFRALARSGAGADVQLVFGSRSANEDITLGVDGLPRNVMRCYSRAAAPAGGLHGRVTDALASLEFDPSHTDFYLCGSSAMVADCRRQLEQRGAQHLFVENF